MEVWDILGLDSCVLSTIYQDGKGGIGDRDGGRDELGIVVWDGSTTVVEASGVLRCSTYLSR